MEDHHDQTTPIPAPGNDPDSQRREIKTRLAAAETRGDTAAAETLRGELDALSSPPETAEADVDAKGKKTRESAAQARRDAAEKDKDKDGEAGKTTPPAGRSAQPPKDTTAGPSTVKE